MSIYQEIPDADMAEMLFNDSALLKNPGLNPKFLSLASSYHNKKWHSFIIQASKASKDGNMNLAKENMRRALFHQEFCKDIALYNKQAK